MINGIRLGRVLRTHPAGFAFKFWFIRVIRVIRGSYFDFPVLDVLERLRRDRRGSAVAFHAGIMIITSPPYLNAIDYIRGHKFSLIWMGHNIEELRGVRTTNVGTEVVAKEEKQDTATEQIMQAMCALDSLSSRHAGMLRRYVRDMRAVLSETKRVLRLGGKAVFVVGNCNLRQIFVENSKCIERLADELGIAVGTVRSRPLPENRRYLPPPESSGAGKQLKKRMREEVILTLLRN
jgi:hypothetical protein